jgi:hypothetical protein
LSIARSAAKISAASSRLTPSPCIMRFSCSIAHHQGRGG